MKLTDLMIQVKNSNFAKELLNNCQLYFVGGAVRDWILGKDPKDIDILVCGLTEEKLVQILSKHGKVDLVGESFGCFKFKPNEFKLEEPLDFALARKEKKTGNGHKGFEMVVDSSYTVLDDLGRRDFTINSIAISLQGLYIIDPFDGMNDIYDKKIRCVNEKAFIEDPLRIMRALQFASRFNFFIEFNTLKMMQDNKHLLSFTNKDCLAGERVFDEVKKVWDKKGDLTKFINDSMPYFGAMYNTEPLNCKCIVKNSEYFLFEDFLYILANFSNIKVDKLIEGMKVDNDTKVRVSCLMEMVEFDQKCLIDNFKGVHSELIRLYKKDVGSLASMFCPYNLTELFYEAVEKCVPISLKELDLKFGINGNTLMSKGLKGRELGDELHRLLVEGLENM